MNGGQEAIAFLVLAWDDIFDPSSPDTFQPRLCNTPSLLWELLDVAILLQGSGKWQRHFDALRAELASVAQAEHEILDAMPFCKWITSVFSRGEVKDMVRLRASVRDCEAQFRGRVEKRLLEVCETLPKGKECAHEALHLWATIGLQSGFTAQEMRALATEESLDLQPRDFAQRIIDAVNAVPIPRWCCLAIGGETADVTALSRKVDFAAVPNKHLEDRVSVQFKAEAQRLGGLNPRCYVAREFVAATARLGAQEAIRSIRDAVDVFNFYSERNAVSVVPLVLVHTAGERVTIPFGAHELRRQSYRRARKLTLGTLRRVPRDNLDGRILNALEHYSLAHSSAATRVQLVNLWTAMECLAGSSESVIAGVSDMVAPIAMLRRCDKVLSHTAKCLQEYRLSGPGLALPPEFDASAGKAVSREALLLTVAKPKDHESIVKLLSFVGRHPLLRNRIYSLWQAFCEPGKLATRLNLSKQRTEWHLIRIYRMRNLIVHSGEVARSEQLQTLLDHLHYYFSITLSRVLHAMQMKPEISVDEAITHWRVRSGFLLDRLKTDPVSLRVRDFFVVPESNHADHVVWARPTPAPLIESAPAPSRG